MIYRSQIRVLRCTLIAVAGLLPVLTQRSAHAQPTQQSAAANPGYQDHVTRDGRGVIFDDDLAFAGGPSSSGALFVPTRAAARATLLRPRFQFVSEMLKSVEHL